MLQSAKSKSIIEKIMLDIDINHLSYVAYAMSFFADSPLDVFPFNADLHKKVISVCYLLLWVLPIFLFIFYLLCSTNIVISDFFR